MLHLLLNLLSRGFVYAPDDPPNGGASDPDAGQGDDSGENDKTPPAEGTSPSMTPATGQGNDPGENDGDTNDDTVSMSKTDFNKRIDKAGRAAVRQVFEALGFENLDDPEALEAAQTDLKTLVEFAREAKREKMSAEERVKADLEDANRKRQKAEQNEAAAKARAEKAETMLAQYVRRTLILGAAEGASNPEDVVLYAQTYQADQYNAILVEDQDLFVDGKLNQAAINKDAVKAILDDCRKERRNWFGVTSRRLPGVPSNSGAQPPTDATTLEQKRQQARNLVNTTR